MSGGVLVVIVLGVAGLLPALAAAGRSPAVLFLAPLIGAGMAGAGAEIEFGAGGGLAVNFAVVAIVVNLGVLAWWLRSGRAGRPGRAERGARSWAAAPWDWSVLTVIVILAFLVLPLSALRAHIIGWDANSIWLTHALMAYGGHNVYLSGLRNAAYKFTNPDYPTLVPGVEGMAFVFYGTGDLQRAVVVTVLLNACALAMAGTGVALAARNLGRGSFPAQLAGPFAGGAVCLAGFAVSGQFGISGYADLLWGAAAAAAVIWGLVLPRSTRALVIAWICAADASLTKTEGFTSAVVIVVLIAIRYQLLTWPRAPWLTWLKRGALGAVPLIPGVAWEAVIRLYGISDNFFTAVSPEPLLMRAQATTAGMGAHLAVGAVDLVVAAAGVWFLRRDRERGGFGNPVWLWLSCLGALGIIFATYVLGDLEIHSWLANSVNRTTIFAQVTLYADLAVWLVLAVDAAFARATPVPGPASDQVPAPAPEQVPWT